MFLTEGIFEFDLDLLGNNSLELGTALCSGAMWQWIGQPWESTNNFVSRWCANEGLQRQWRWEASAEGTSNEGKGFEGRVAACDCACLRACVLVCVSL
jgi:hypothetical protein